MIDYVLRLQRTVGNQATSQFLQRLRSESAAAMPRSAGAAEATRGGSAAPLDAQPASRARVPVTREEPVIQRKLTLAKDRFEKLTSTKAALTQSTFAQLADTYAKYLKMDQPTEEYDALRRMKRLAITWRMSAKPASDYSAKRQLVKELEDQIKRELPIGEAKVHKQHLCEEIGLPAAYLNTWKDADVTTLGEASQALKRGDVSAADQYLTQLRASIGDVVNLIKSALLSRHIGKVDPKMAKVLGNAHYKLKKADAGKALSHVAGLAHARASAKDADKEEIKNFGPLYKDVPLAAHERQQKSNSKQIKGLAPAEATAILGYTTPLFGEYSNPLRKDLGTKKFDENKQALTKATMSGLNKLKPLKATLYRHIGIFAGYKELNQPGATVSDMGFMSSTKSHFVAGNAGAQHDVLEIIESKTGRDVSEVSTFPHEMEVLFKPGTRFQITRRYDKDQVHTPDVWHPNLSEDAAKYLAADSKKAKLQIIVFKKEV